MKPFDGQQKLRVGSAEWPLSPALSSSVPLEMTTKPVVDLTDYKDPKACSDLKAVHDTCFHKWMREKFLPGTATEDECKVEWDAYQVCLEVRLQ